MENTENKNTSDEICADCGTIAAGGKTGCLALFEAVIAREFSDFRYGRIHRLTVDAYSLQHPDQYRRSGKSFAAHLTGLCATLASENALEVNRTIQRWLSLNPVIQKPAHIPERRGDLTIIYVHDASDADEHILRVSQWARAVWEAWSEHHLMARQLIDRADTEINHK